jgi:hypothetical protein
VQVAEQILEATIEAVVIRADGTVEDLGTLDTFVRTPEQEQGILWLP